jgi:hypothetical protein
MPDDVKDDLMHRVEQEAEGFSVHSDSTANWLIRKIVECRDYRERIERWAALEIKRADREEAFFMIRFGHQLETWARGQIAKQRGRKSIKLPAGTVGFRTEPTRLAVKDEPALLAWCKANLPGAIQTVRHVLKSSVKDHIGDTGEIPNGAEIAGGQQKFFIK